jgi:hypothetical protein
VTAVIFAPEAADDLDRMLRISPKTIPRAQQRLSMS